MKLRIILTILLASFSCAAVAAEKEETAFRIHGRLSLYNGIPGFRIWIVGTKRILGIAESPPERPLMPTQLLELAREENTVFGDFTVVPLTNDEPGVMRMVRVIRAEHLVVTDGNLKVLQKIDTPIEDEANQSSQQTPPGGE